jgi:ribosome maturation factor RimP
VDKFNQENEKVNEVASTGRVISERNRFAQLLGQSVRVKKETRLDSRNKYSPTNIDK